METTCQPVYINNPPIGGEGAIKKHDQDPNDYNLTWKRLYPELKESPLPVQKVVSKINQYEKDWNIQLPEDLKEIAAWRGIFRAMFYAFPTNNWFIVPGEKIWSNETIGREWKLEKFTASEDFMIQFMDENQGCCYWYAGWKKNDNHFCRIYVSSDCNLSEFSDVTLAGDSLCLFLQEYVSQGKSYYMNQEEDPTV